MIYFIILVADVLLTFLDFMIMQGSVLPGAVLGGGATGASAPVTLSLDPRGPPERESASIIQWQISCTDFVLKGKVEIKCISSLLPNQNCWNCKHCLKSHLSLVWMRDLSFFHGLYVPPNKKAGNQPGPPIKTGLEPPLRPTHDYTSCPGCAPVHLLV